MRPTLAVPVAARDQLQVPDGAPDPGADRLRHVLEAQREIAAAGDDYGYALATVCEQLVSLTTAQSVTVFLVEGRELVARASAGSIEGMATLRLSIAGTYSGRILRTGVSAIVDDCKNDPRTSFATGVPVIGSLLIVPLRHRGESLGQIHLVSHEVQAFDHGDLELVELLSVYVSLALARVAEADALRRFATVFDKATVGMARWDHEGRIFEANAALARMLGYTVDELLGCRFEELTHPADSHTAQTFAQALVTDSRGLFQLEKRYVCKDGSELWAQVIAVRDGVDSTGLPIGIALIEDISERKQKDLTLRRNSGRLELVVETQGMLAATDAPLHEVMQLITERSQLIADADGAVVSLLHGDDLVVVAASGVCVDLIDTHRRRTASAAGYALANRRSFLSTDAPNDSILNQAIVRKLGERSHVCVPLFHGDRALGALDVSTCSEQSLTEEDVQALELLCVVLSAAISRAAEADAKREQLDALARFRAVYDSAPVGILLCEVGGRLVDANPAFLRMLGYTAAELSEVETIDELIHPDDLEETRRLRAEYWRRGDRSGFKMERRYIRKDGTVIWGESSTEYSEDPDGQPAFMLMMLQDVTQRKATEEQLRQAQKMEAVGQLTAGIAHDFNNLLMGVLGYSGFLRERMAAGTQDAEYLERIEGAAKRAAALTQQLLAFGRQQALQPQTMDLNEHVVDAVSMVGRVLGEHIEIRVDLEPELAPLRADPTQIHQVLLNLALNARDAMPDGGVLRIATVSVPADAPEVPATVERSAGYVRLTVADTGCGMPPEVRERIFDPFFTTKAVGAGSGLGLASVYGIVKQSNGEIAVESDPGAGTTFTIWLPALTS